MKRVKVFRRYSRRFLSLPWAQSESKKEISQCSRKPTGQPGDTLESRAKQKRGKRKGSKPIWQPPIMKLETLKLSQKLIWIHYIVFFFFFFFPPLSFSQNPFASPEKNKTTAAPSHHRAPAKRNRKRAANQAQAAGLGVAMMMPGLSFWGLGSRTFFRPFPVLPKKLYLFPFLCRSSFRLSVGFWHLFPFPVSLWFFKKYLRGIQFYQQVLKFWNCSYFFCFEVQKTQLIIPFSFSEFLFFLGGVQFLVTLLLVQTGTFSKAFSFLIFFGVSFSFLKENKWKALASPPTCKKKALFSSEMKMASSSKEFGLEALLRFFQGLESPFFWDHCERLIKFLLDHGGV